MTIRPWPTARQRWRYGHHVMRRRAFFTTGTVRDGVVSRHPLGDQADVAFVVDHRATDEEIAAALPRAVAAYKQYDVLLVNAIFDGMNLVAKEAPLVNERDGVLVLSENTGAHEELGDWALTVNPFDVTAQAEALHEAIRMAPDERRRRHDRIRGHVRGHGIDGWIEAQLADLDEVLERSRTRISA